MENTIETPLESQETLQTIPEKTETPKPRFRITLQIKLLILTIISIALIAVVLSAIKGLQAQKEAEVKFLKEQSTQYEQQPVADWKTTENAKDKLIIKYPENVSIKTPADEDENRIYTLSYSGERQLEPITTEQSLNDGFYVKIIVNPNVSNSNMKELALRKRSSYKQICEASFSVTDVMSKNIDTIPGETFSIINCPQDIEETFVYLHKSVYEIVQIYRGDIGFKEKYKQTTNEIVNNLSFMDKPLAEESPKFKTYYNEQLKISFVHPLLDEGCCDVNGPVWGNAKKIAVLGDKASFDQNSGKSFNGFGIFLDENGEGRTLEEYVQIQKQTLVEDYKVITGRIPLPTEEDISIGETKGIILKDAAWWGDMVYFKLPGTNKIMILSKVETSSGVFNQVFKEILNTFRFNVLKIN